MSYFTYEELTCTPIRSYAELLVFIRNPPPWRILCKELTPHSELKIKNMEIHNHVEIFLDEPETFCHINPDAEDPKRTEAKSLPKTLVCHDMANGYHDDSFVDGTEERNAYTFYNWAGIDIFCYFSHHLITIPPLGWINVAHAHGVQVIGTLITEWNEGVLFWDNILESEAMYQNFASALVTVTKMLKFDGWLLNVENKISKPTLLVEFVQHLRKLLHEEIPDSVLIWYDSVTIEGHLNWQNGLNHKNRAFFDACDGIFTNYSWTEFDIVTSAIEAGDRIADLYIGIDVWGRNFFGGGKLNTQAAIKLAHEEGCSLAIFAPAWTHEAMSRDKEDPNYVAMADELDDGELFQLRDRALWDSLWPYLHTRLPSQLPFQTSFCRGLGKKRRIYGEVVSRSPWYNLRHQHYQPNSAHGPHGYVISTVEVIKEVSIQGMYKDTKGILRIRETFQTSRVELFSVMPSAKKGNDEDAACTSVAVPLAAASPGQAPPVAEALAVVSPVAASPVEASPAAEIPVAASLAVASPAAASPASASPAVASPAATSPAVASPVAASSASAFPAAASSVVASPAVESPAVASSAVAYQAEASRGAASPVVASPSTASSAVASPASTSPVEAFLAAASPVAASSASALPAAASSAVASPAAASSAAAYPTEASRGAASPVAASPAVVLTAVQRNTVKKEPQLSAAPKLARLRSAVARQKSAIRTAPPNRKRTLTECLRNFFTWKSRNTAQLPSPEQKTVVLAETASMSKREQAVLPDTDRTAVVGGESLRGVTTSSSSEALAAAHHRSMMAVSVNLRLGQSSAGSHPRLALAALPQEYECLEVYQEDSFMGGCCLRVHPSDDVCHAHRYTRLFHCELPVRDTLLVCVVTKTLPGHDNQFLTVHLHTVGEGSAVTDVVLVGHNLPQTARAAGAPAGGVLTVAPLNTADARFKDVRAYLLLNETGFYVPVENYFGWIVRYYEVRLAGSRVTSVNLRTGSARGPVLLGHFGVCHVPAAPN